MISSNLERLLYLVCGKKTAGYMERLWADSFYNVSEAERKALQTDFFPARCGEEECALAIRRVYEESGYLCDTHTAVAFSALRQYREAVRSGAPAVVLSTASPFKFPAAVLRALEGSAPENEFEAIVRLESTTGVAAPRALTSLKEAPQRRKDVVNLEEMEGYILGKAEQSTW